jgi:C-terminal processing protease CtpA/Prc
MSNMNRKSYLVILFLALVSRGFGQTSKQVENAIAFTRLYGYVRYFHPSDEAASLDWSRFAVLGARRAEACQSTEELQATLEELFHPIAPTVRILPDGRRDRFGKGLLTPGDLTGYRVVSWQYVGIVGENGGPYRTARTNRPNPARGKADPAETAAKPAPLFDKAHQVGAYADKEIGVGLRAVIPLALYGTEKQTYPAADGARHARLQGDLAVTSMEGLSAKDRYVRLAGIAIAWNTFQHFYPYFDVTRTDWGLALREAIRKSYVDRTEADFQRTLQEMTAKLRDGHLRVIKQPTEARFTLPIAWEWVEDRLVVTKSLDRNSPLAAGDVVTSINGESPEAYFKEVYRYISAATKGFLAHRAQAEALLGEEGSSLGLKVRGADNIVRDVTLKRDRLPSPARSAVPNDTIRQLGRGIIYINMGTASMEAIRKAMPLLQKSQGIICDLRGYPAGNHRFMEYLLPSDDTSSQWMQVPQIISPDQEGVVGFQKFSWDLKARPPRLKAKVIYLTDGRAISYAESYLGFVQHYRLATIVGQPTAGTNGDVNVFSLPGDYRIYWTGMKVLRHDGSIHHGVGIQPDVYVERTVQGIRENRDEFLEKAVELLNAAQ